MIKSGYFKSFWLVTWGLYIFARLLNILFGLNILIVDITFWLAVAGLLAIFYNFFIRKKKKK